MTDFYKIKKLLKENENWNKELLKQILNNEISIGFKFDKNGNIEYWYTL